MKQRSAWGWNYDRQGGERWRGKIPIPPNAHPLVRRLIQECNAQRTTLTEIAQRSGVGRQTISLWRYRAAPNLDNLIACFNVLGLDLIVAHKAGSNDNKEYREVRFDA